MATKESYRDRQESELEVLKVSNCRYYFRHFCAQIFLKHWANIFINLFYPYE